MNDVWADEQGTLILIQSSDGLQTSDPFKKWLRGGLLPPLCFGQRSYSDPETCQSSWASGLITEDRVGLLPTCRRH